MHIAQARVGTGDDCPRLQVVGRQLDRMLVEFQLLLELLGCLLAIRRTGSAREELGAGLGDRR